MDQDKVAMAHRRRQRLYRERLREMGNPESDDVQRAVFAVLREMTFTARHGTAKPEVKSFLLQLYDESLARLELKGFSRKYARRRLSLALTPTYPGDADEPVK